MLTAGLEKWIQKGKAEFKTFAVGGSGVGTIPIPKNKFIIICDFDFFYFTDILLGNPYTRSVYQLQFSSQKSNNHFIIRNPCVDFSQFINFNPYHKDTYLVHEGNVNIDIVNVPPPSSWVITDGQLDAKSNEKPLPVGYGIGGAGLPATLRIDFSATENYLPLTQERTNTAPGNFYREQFKVDVNAANKLNDAQADNTQGNYSYPIINVGFVQFNMNLNEFVQASN